MGLHIGDIAPDFTAETTTGEINFHDWSGRSWIFFFSHPGDFTPVCTTEIGRTAQLITEFQMRNVKPLGLSTDGVAEHLLWIKDVDDTQHTTVTFPIVADPDSKIARLYDMIHEHQSSSQAVRSVFIIDPNKMIRLMLTYPMNIGRNFDEILRVIDALQLADAKHIATPADWQPGSEVIIPTSIDNAAAKVQFPQGWNEIRPYLRLTDQSADNTRSNLASGFTPRSADNKHVQGNLRKIQMPFDDYLQRFDYQERVEMKIQTKELLELYAQGAVQLIDIRFREEQAAWQIGIGVHIPLNELPDRLEEIDSGKTVVTMCPHYDRAEIARLYLTLCGFKARYLTDGMLGLADYLRGERARDYLQRLQDQDLQ